MKTNDQSTMDAEVDCDLKVSPKYERIKVSIDWHANQYRVARIIDNAAPEPAQRFSPEEFLEWMKKQFLLAAEVHSCYEAGAGGFVLHRQLSTLGVKNLVIAPYNLDKARKRVQTDSTDARQLVQDLDRYVRGNDKALRPVYVPTPEQEERRAESRQRQQLQEHRLSMATQGRTLLLGRGFRYSNQWWKAQTWERLKEKLPQSLIEMLERFRELILAIDQQVSALRLKIEKSAPTLRPKGLGALSFEGIAREVCDFKRFRNRKAPGSYAGLTGGVSATDDHYRDLSITKAGNRRLRTMLIESAWRWVYYQPQSKLIQRWKEVLLNPKAHVRARKRAIVAVARQLFVDLWRWQTGRSTPEQLGWVMTEANS
jgi:transposase